jgi:hypothetical protein
MSLQAATTKAILNHTTTDATRPKPNIETDSDLKKSSEPADMVGDLMDMDF